MPSQILQGGDSSASLPPANAEDGSIYVSHKYHRYSSRSIEDTNNRNQYDSMDGATNVPHPIRLESSFSASRAGSGEKQRQYRSSDDLAGDEKQNLGGETVLFAAPRISNPISALTPSDRPLDFDRASPKITPKVEEGGEDDVPVSIRKSFKELRSVKDELERQRGENERLRTELAATAKEATDTLARLNKMKQMTKKSIESTSDTIAELRKELVALKSQSDESFAFAAQARSALPDISDIRVTIKDSSENCRRAMEDLAKAAGMKGLVRDLELECSNARKANDFLRDKLTDITSQYADAMERLRGVEYNHANQTNALRVALDDLHNTNLVAASSTAKLDATQRELSNALTACALAKESNAQLEKRTEKLVRDAEEKALVTVTLQRENAELRILLQDRESSVTSVLSLKQESDSYDAVFIERSAVRVGHFEEDFSRAITNDGGIKRQMLYLERENEVRKQELSNQISENAALRAAWEASNEREILLSTTIERLKAEKSAVETQSQAVQVEIQQVTEERKQEKDRMTQLQMRCHSLQERFEDQSATLKLARESHGDMQERLITAEAGFALEAETGKLRQEVLAVQERNGLLQKSVDEYRRQLENQQELATTMRNEYEKRLKDERDGGHSRMQVLQERMLQGDLERAQAVKKADELRDSLTTAQGELTTLREQVQNIQTSKSEWGNQVKDLTVRNHALQAENATLLERGTTIGARYDANDLSIQEKTLVNRIQEESRSFHEKRIMDKQNELRRRDNQITEQEARIKSLEKGLARHLKSQDPKFAPGSDAHSILNLSKFASSSSPPRLIAASPTLMSGACTTPLPACHPLQTSSEHFKGASNQVQSSYVVALSAFSADREGDTVISRVAREPLADGDPASDASRTIMLGKHDRPLSQTSQGGSGNSETTRPQRRLKSSKKSRLQASEMKAEPELKPRPRKRK
ncbi:hypothetical protein BJV77DRAFT_1064239 [Russula vinacea]|nr:hypothetical protein BJV77DRAFT_1064239 [Russula vinacea]